MSEETSEQTGWEEVGKVSHWFGNPQVVAMKLSGDLKVGDTIRFEKSDLEQQVGSMQIEKNPVQEASGGDEVGVKVEGLEEGKKIHPGERVLKSAE